MGPGRSPRRAPISGRACCRADEVGNRPLGGLQKQGILKRMDAFGSSDVGLVRKNNEDSIFMDAARGLLIVADGMGGHVAGEVASQLTVETVSERVQPAVSWWPFGRPNREKDILVEAIRASNRAVRNAAEEDETRHGMGTTIVALWTQKSRAHVAHVGDSRIYRFRRGGLVQLTRDHSWPSEDGSMQNVLTRAIGAEAEVEIDHRIVEIADGDIFVLCSDGLTRTVDDSAIAGVIQEATDGQAAVGQLISLAKGAGAPDNVTVALGYCGRP